MNEYTFVVMENEKKLKNKNRVVEYLIKALETFVST
jgi:hypothetical protein